MKPIHCPPGEKNSRSPVRYPAKSTVLVDPAGVWPAAARRSGALAAIYGLEERSLVLELAPGPDLSERIAAGPIPLEEALPIARQLAAQVR